MESRHLTMISLGGVIGTGLFVSPAIRFIRAVGPVFTRCSLLVYCVMVSLGELSVARYAGSFHMLRSDFIPRSPCCIG